MMRTEHAEIEAAYEKGDMVTVCWEPDCSMHRLYYWEESKWVPHQKRGDYPNYTHSICEKHYHMYQEELEQLIAEETAFLDAVDQEIAAPVAA